MTQGELFEREDFIREEISRTYVAADDDWKKMYYDNALKFLTKHKLFDGGQLCAFCREQGMPEPHHHNVWGAMVNSLRKMGWTEKVGMMVPTTMHTHINYVCQWKSKLYKGKNNEARGDTTNGGKPH
jgi:hypothetical protein